MNQTMNQVLNRGLIEKVCQAIDRDETNTQCYSDIIYKHCQEHNLLKDEIEAVFEQYYDDIIVSSNLTKFVQTIRENLLDSWPNINFRSMTKRQLQDIENIYRYALLKHFEDEEIEIAVSYKNRLFDLKEFVLLKLKDI